MSSRSVAAYLAFFLSGASSLIFQTIWTRMLHHVFGATSVAISTVLTVFMAGLGLGAWLGGRYANRIKHPIITYAVAEIGVGVWGLLVPLLVRPDGWLADVNAFLRAEFGAESGLFMIARFLCVAPILIIPTTLMGSTLPLLTRHFVSAAQSSQAAGARVGVLYALNTFGAATGPLLSAFLLMPSFGLSITNIVACSMNFSLAILIFAARRSLLEGMWTPGERLRFWPGTAEEAAPPEAKAKAKDAEVVEKEAFDDLRLEDAQVGVYRDPAERAVDEDAAEDDPRPRKKRRRRAPEDAAPPAGMAPETRRGLLIRGSVFLGLALLAGLSLVGTGGLEVVVIRILLFAGAGASLLALLLAVGEALRDPGDDAEESDEADPAPRIPELARKAAYLAFAASGAAALCYEVVWSRALAMTIGSSIYSFSLILETFLIGIAAGSAAMSSFMGRRSSPFLGIGITSAALVLFANVPWLVDIVDPTDVERRTQGSVASYLLLSLCYIAPIALAVIWISLRMRKRPGDEAAFRDDLAIWRPLLIVGIAALPVIAAGINAGHFPGFFPQILLSVVACVAVFLIVCALLARTPSLLVAVIQLFIAGATVVSYYWQDEIPYAFAQLVAGIPSSALPDRVGIVQLFMFATIVLCTLPSTLGMGAMFPLTVRVWTAGGDQIAKDVAVVYTGNTVGSIIGSWLPGFVLFALVGAEHTLHLGVALNMILALILLIAGAADPSEDQSWWTWRRVSAVGLPAVAALMMAIELFMSGLDHPLMLLHAAGVLGFLGLAGGEYAWLRRCDSPNRPAVLVAAALACVPLLTTIALAVWLATPPETAEWALRAVVLALKGFLVLVGAALTWANWREWQAGEPRPAPAAAEGV